MKNGLTNKIITDMKNYKNYICLFLLLIGIGTNQEAFGAANIADGRYELVTDLSTLSSGDKILICGTAANMLYAAKPFTGESADKLTVYSLGSWSTTNPTTSYDITTTMGICEFTLGGTSGAWTFYDGNYSVYQDNDGKLVTTSGSGHTNTWVITSNCDGVANCTKVSQITIKTTAEISKKYMAYNSSGSGQFRCYTSAGGMYVFKRVAAVTLYDGANGTNKSSIAIDDYFPNDAVAVPGWAFIGYWATSADKDCEPDYPSYSTYNSGDQAAAGTYYAIYQGNAYGCNYGNYSCKPTPTYVLSLENPSSGSGVNWVVADVGCGPAGTTVTLTYTINVPGTSYQGATITRDDNGQAVSFTHDAEEQTVTFTFPTSDVTAEISFECPDLTSKTVTINDIVPYYDNGVWKANVTWGTVTGATQYGIQVNDVTGSSTFLPATYQTGTSYLLTGLTEGHTYRAGVRANNPCTSNNSTPVATKDFTPACPTLTGTLAISKDAVGQTSAAISWGGVTTTAIPTGSGSSSVITYDVSITVEGGAEGGVYSATGTTDTEWSSNSLITNKTYTVTVHAYNVCGDYQDASTTFKTYNYIDYQFTCADLSITDEEASVSKTPIWITTSAGQIVRSQKALHIEGTGLAPNATFSFTIGGVAANDCSGTGEHDLFAIRNADYSAVTANPSGVIDADVYVFYNPTATTDGLDQPGSTIEATSAAGKVGDREYKSMSATLSTTSVNGRHLPSQFVMAARVGKTWYALPGNITTNATQDPMMIGVDNATNPTIAYCPSGYGFRIVGLASTELTPNGSTANNATGGRGFQTDGEKVKFGLQNNLPMFGSTTTTLGNGGGATSLWGGGYTYFWTLEHQNTAASNINAVTYNIRTANTNLNPLIRLNRGQWKWGLYSGGVEEIRLLSISPVADLTLDVMEWGTNEMAVKYTGDGTLTKVQIGDTEEGSATMSPIGGDLQRISGLSSMAAGAGGKQCQQMLIQITESGVLKQKILQVPFIVTGTNVRTDDLRTWTDGATATEQDSITYNMEIVVRPGAKLTTNSGAGKFGKLSVYPGGAAEISNAIRVARFNMRGGYSWLGGAFAMPHANVTGNVTGTGNVVYYDYYIDATKYYDLALPKTMTWGPVTDDTGYENFKFWVKEYDGATRATTGKGWTWYNWDRDASLWTINAGQGYLVAATPRYGRPYLVMHFPMPLTLAADESSKDPVSVKAYGMTGGSLNPGVSANNAGWNFIANPFMTSYMKNADGVDAGGTAIEGSIKTGKLVEEIKDGKWTGKYVWDETGGKKIRYVTTYDYSTEKYTQHAMSSTVLEPFTGFFIQVAEDCYVKFDPNERQNNIIARRQKSNLPDDMEVGITASIGEQSDETIILLCDELSRDNALEFPDESSKIMNAGQLNFYTFAGTNTMYANGMTYAEGQEWNAAGLTATVDGEYTFSASKVNTEYVKAVMLKDMNTNTEYDLLMSDVTIYLEKGTIDGRFAIKIVLKSEEEVTTLLDQINEDGINRGPEKFIYNDVMYIRHNGRIYDATGRIVKDINK